MSGIYKAFSATADSNNAYDESKYKTGLRSNANKNFGGTAGGNPVTKLDKGDLKHGKVKEQVDKAYEKITKSDDNQRRTSDSE